MKRRTCTRCESSRSHDNFYKGRAVCKVCVRAQSRANREAKIDYYRAYDRVRYAEHGHRGEPTVAAKRRAKRAWIARNSVRRAAQVALNNALRDGKLKRARTCSSCRKRGTMHAHHDNYEKPLAVRWLCTRCHADEHRRFNVDQDRKLLARHRR